MNFTVNC